MKRPLQFNAAATRLRLVLLGVLLALPLGAGCGPTPDDGSVSGSPAAGAVGEPVRVDLSATDPESRELLRGLLDQVNADPESAARRAALGMAYEINGMTRAAAASYEQAVALEPEEPRWTYYLAQARSLIGDLEGAMTAIDRAVELDSSYAPAQLYRGWWLLDLGRPEDALAAFEAAARLDDNGPASSLGRGRALIKLGRPDEAIQVLNRLSSSYRHPYLHQLLGQALRQKGQLEQAKVVLSRSRPQQRPGWPDPWHNEKLAYGVGFAWDMNRAKALLASGRTQEAIVLLEELRLGHPDNERLLNNLAIAYRRVGRADNALEVLRSGLETNPDHYGYHFNMSSLLSDAGDFEGALRHLDRAIEINPTLGKSYTQKGNFYLRLGRKAEALEAFESGLLYDARDARTHFVAGVLSTDLGDADGGISHFQRALRLDPGEPQIYLALSRALALGGQYDRARLALARAGELGARPADVARMRQQIESTRSESRP